MARQQIAVEIDHSRLVPLAALERGAGGSIDLTTIVERQQRAVIRLFVLSDAAPKLLTTISLEQLDQSARRRPVLQLTATIRGRSAVCTVMVDGDRSRRTRIDVSEWVPARKLGVPIAVVALLLLLLAGGGWLVRGMLRPAASAPPPPVAAAPPPATPSPRETAPRAPATTTPAAPAPEVPAPAAETPGPAAPPVSPTPPAPPAATDPGPAAAPLSQQPVAPALVGRQQRTVYFFPDSDVLTARAREELQQIAAWLDELPADGIEVRIEGHCAPAGSERGRLELSRSRARTVERFLRGAGWSPAREPLVEGFSSDRPASLDPQEQHLNRRVEVIVLAAN